MFEAPYYPIVYVRGYAMTQSQVESTVATPYMGFNLGSTKVRQRWTGQIQKYVFESPLLRLMKDHGYRDIYQRGGLLPASEQVPARSIWIYRYYEEASEDLGRGERLEIEHYAEGLHEFIERIRSRMCRPKDAAPEAVREDVKCEDFRVHLVAHSMGGLVVRCYLQNICREKEIGPPVDKVFTYATPHGGIDVRGFGNVPSFLQINNVDNFNEGRMREYLSLGSTETSVRSLDGAFPQDRFFCLVGTNHRDYAVPMSRHLVGPMSDGLVMIKNASVESAPRAFVHRSHSGHYGIVNSEEGYQNLRRFLFGDMRVDGLLEFEQITLPPDVQAEKEKGKTIRASYHVEVITCVRGDRTDLHRRTTNEESALLCTYDRYVKAGRLKHLFSGFLLTKARVNKARESLGFSIDLRVLVPEYEVEGFWFNDNYYEGGYIYRDKINLELTAGEERSGEERPRLRYGFDSRTPNRTTRQAEGIRVEAAEHPEQGAAANWHYEFRIPVRSRTESDPHFRGALVLRARPWS